MGTQAPTYRLKKASRLLHSLRAGSIGCGIYLLVVFGSVVKYPIHRSLTEITLMIFIGLLATALGVGLSVNLVSNYDFSRDSEGMGKELVGNILPLGGILGWLLLDVASLLLNGPNPGISWALELLVSLLGGWVTTQLCVWTSLSPMVIAVLIFKKPGVLRSDQCTFQILAVVGVAVGVAFWWFCLFPRRW